ncbi:hypothetical protein [Microbacterium sp. NC79]|uniref:hypothetical protein n=1 Tax=Microbacterium sp. NC79 TaxID=2851009 RepID=UPI001C2BFF00|nr:hypothetical protein [Microbacterium sp. NC79]MBV0895969.1 hypothetical protein [Microbacterium sp. NC79]
MTILTTFRVPQLDWHPKQFRPGDMDGKGGDRLLGRTELTPLEVLVRETAQNSWDARRDGQTPSFGIHLRRLDFRLRGDLQTLLGEAKAPGHSVKSSANSIHILEIYDRGTTGLDGPVDLRTTGPDVPKNYEDLILKVGVPRDDGQGGGTYGFGKTAAYAYSGIGVVVYWTRCVGMDGKLEHRFIVSAFQDSYNQGKTQYTGRHWWGLTGDEIVLPVVGDDAQRLGEHFFSRHYDSGETGTSMLIVDPRIPNVVEGASGAEEAYEIDRTAGSKEALEDLFARDASQAIRRHLWPKLIPVPDHDEDPMGLNLIIAGVQVPLKADPAGALDLWGAALNAIRATRRGETGPFASPQSLPIKVQAITRHNKVIGHLAFVRRVTAMEPLLASDDLDPLKGESQLGRIALMRDSAELIVSTEHWVDHGVIAGYDWLAVYKSTPEFDRIYADAEPPAHDAWVEEGGGEAGRVARHTRLTVARWIRDELAPPVVSPSSEGEKAHVGGLSRRFASLLPAPKTPGVVGGGTKAGRNGKHAVTSAGTVEVHSVRLIETLADGRQRQRVDFTPLGDAQFLAVRLAVSTIGEGIRESVNAAELEPVWLQNQESNGSIECDLPVGQPAALEFVGAARRAFRIELTAGESSWQQ